MPQFLDLYSITLDFIFKMTGPITGIIVIGLCFIYRKQLADFLVSNIQRIKGRIFNQEIDIELRKREQSIPVIKDEEKEILKRDKDELLKALEFEKIYSIIFGSQIELLKDISVFKDLPYTKLTGYFYFLDKKREFSIFDSWNYDEYLKVLINNNLIELKPIESDQKLEITKKGLDFLVYIDENNYNDRLF